MACNCVLAVVGIACIMSLNGVYVYIFLKQFLNMNLTGDDVECLECAGFVDLGSCPLWSL